VADNGLNMVLYLDDDPDLTGVSAHTWVECDIVADVTVNQGRNKGTVKNRGMGTEKYLAGLKTRSIDIELTHEPLNAQWIALNTAYETGAVIGVAAMDKALNVDGAVGLQMDCIVTEFTQTQPLEDSSNWKAKLEPAALSAFEPAHVTINI
jgi:hypothetical protein